jgi:hypothetical protein
MTRSQRIISACWVLGPFALLAVLFVLNPVYVGKMTRTVFVAPGIILLFTVQALNILILAFGFSTVNKARSSGKVTRQGALMATIAIATVTFFVLTLPALWCAVFYPSVVTLLQTNPEL